MKLSGKQICVVTVIGIILVTMAAYVFAVKKTIQTVNNCEAMQHTIDSAFIAPQQMEVLKKEIEIFKSSIGETSSPDVDFQIRLIQLIGDFCAQNRMLVSSFPNPHVFAKNEFELQTFQFTVMGTYVQQIRLLKMMEQQKIGAKIVSVLFDTKKDLQQKNESLFMTVYIQKIHETHENNTVDSN